MAHIFCSVDEELFDALRETAEEMKIPFREVVGNALRAGLIKIVDDLFEESE